VVRWFKRKELEMRTALKGRCVSCIWWGCHHWGGQWERWGSCSLIDFEAPESTAWITDPGGLRTWRFHRCSQWKQGKVQARDSAENRLTRLIGRLHTENVQPEWGKVFCTEQCPSHNGERCEQTGCRLTDRYCLSAVHAMMDELASSNGRS
jgi:hypothetical protein